MALASGLQPAWRAFWILRRQRSEAAWVRVLIATVLAFLLSMGLILLAGLLRLSWFDPLWWRKVAIPLAGVGTVAGITLLATFRALELACTQATLTRLQANDGWRTGVMLNLLAAAGLALGCAIGMRLVQLGYDTHAWDGLAPARQTVHAALFILVLLALNMLASLFRARQRDARSRAAQAQWQLLQAQIEPQFLFNTLRDVQDLLDHDPGGARQMLEDFTDYLRASLGQLRRADSTLGAELDMARSYLQLLQQRQGARLAWSIEASASASAAVVPPLLLQPLVDHAVGHGWARKDDGGSVHIRAQVDGDRLRIAVLGHEAGSAAPRPGAAATLSDIRQRLLARYGETATLSVTQAGTHAILDLPLIGTAVDPSHGA